MIIPSVPVGLNLETGAKFVRELVGVGRRMVRLFRTMLQTVFGTEAETRIPPLTFNRSRKLKPTFYR